MLQSLKDRDPDSARRALVAAAQQVLNGEYTHADGLVRDVLDEVVTRSSKISDVQRRRAEAASLLSRAISDALLPEAEMPAVRARLGESGRLPKGLFKIEVTPKFRANIDYYCVREAHARSAITHGEGAQHFTTQMEGKEGVPFRSLFTQKQGAFTVIVLAMREGDTLLIDDAYRVYHDEVDVSSSQTPLEMFSAFLNVYGIDGTAEIDGKQIAGPFRLLHEFLAHVPIGARLEIKREGRVMSAVERSLLPGAVAPEEDDDRVEITLDYAVSVPAYRQSMARHGLTPGHPGAPNSGMFRQVLPKAR